MGLVVMESARLAVQAVFRAFYVDLNHAGLLLWVKFKKIFSPPQRLKTQIRRGNDLHLVARQGSEIGGVSGVARL
jgi:hypothetical protein